LHKLALAVNRVIASMLRPSQAAAQETKLETKTAKERSQRKWFDEHRPSTGRPGRALTLGRE
jgi:hypothetical protein